MNEKSFHREGRAPSETRQRLATGGIVQPGAPFPATGKGCALAIPATATCDCGRDLHITVHLDRKQIETAVNQILIDARRRAATRGSR